MLSKIEKLISLLLILFILIQIIVPFRYLYYPGPSAWNEEAHKFIWHMKLAHKKAYAQFIVFSPSLNKSYKVDTRKFLTSWQYEVMVSNPRLILQFAHYLRDLYKERGINDIVIKVEAKTSLNNRPLQYLVDPNVDLAKKENTLKHFDWIMPLNVKVVPKHSL